MKTCSILVPLLMALSTSVFSAGPENASRVDFVVYDIGADRSVAHSTVEFAVYSDCTSGPEIVHSSGLTGENGEFQASLSIGRHLANSTLEFRRYSKGRGELLGSAITDSEDAADLSAIYIHPNAAGGLDA